MFQNINILILNRTILISSSRHSDLIDVLREVNTIYQDSKSETNQVFTDAKVLPLHTLDIVLDIRWLMFEHNGSSSAYALLCPRMSISNPRYNSDIRARHPESFHSYASCSSYTSCCSSCHSSKVQTGEITEADVHTQHVGIQMELHSHPME